MGNPDSTPIAPEDRIAILDALRGMALCGILLANILVFSGWIFLSPEQAGALSPPSLISIEKVAHLFLIDGKFYTIFSLLFGLGFTLQLSRLEQRGANGIAIFYRRLLVLLAIGLIHMVLIWQGDILTLYALLGMLLPLCRKWRDRSLLIAAALLLLSPLVGVPLFAALGWTPWEPFTQLAMWFAVKMGGAMDPLAQMQRTGGWDFLTFSMVGWPFRISMLIEWWRAPKVLGIMLIGMWCGRRLIAGALLENRRLLWWTLGLGLAIGAPLSLLYATTPGVSQSHWAAVIGTAPMGLAYAAGFVLLWPRIRALAVFAAPGRMALTNYLTHSIVGIALFYGVGLGLAGRVGLGVIYGSAVLLLAVQIVLSNWWLKRHARGPMEALWRWGTYGGQAMAARA